jgi:phage shock protein E
VGQPRRRDGRRDARLTAQALSSASLVALLALSVFAASAAEERPPAQIDASELAERISAGSAPLILDVRTPAEFAAGHLPGARNLPHDALAGRLGELGIAPSTEIVVHCHSGSRAAAAERVLRDAGYTSVRDLEGHWQGWREAGLPTE